MMLQFVTTISQAVADKAQGSVVHYHGTPRYAAVVWAGLIRVFLVVDAFDNSSFLEVFCSSGLRHRCCFSVAAFSVDPALSRPRAYWCPDHMRAIFGSRLRADESAGWLRLRPAACGVAVLSSLIGRIPRRAGQNHHCFFIAWSFAN